MILFLLLGVVVVNNCPTVESGPCATTIPFEAHNTIEFHSSDPGWPCDGTVWWEARLDSEEPPVEIRCAIQTTPTDDTVVYCPDKNAPVKHWNRIAGQSAWLDIRACNADGCGLECFVELIWPDYICFNGAC